MIGTRESGKNPCNSRWGKLSVHPKAENLFNVLKQKNFGVGLYPRNKSILNKTISEKTIIIFNQPKTNRPSKKFFKRRKVHPPPPGL